LSALSSFDILFDDKTVFVFEVDFILGGHTAIEIKAKKTITTQDLKSLKALNDRHKPNLPSTRM